MVAVEKELPQILRDCVNFLQSEAMFLTLSNLTGLRLHKLAAVQESDSDSESEEEDTVGSSHDVSSDGQFSGSESEGTAEKLKPKKKRQKLNSETKQNQQGCSDSIAVVSLESPGREYFLCLLCVLLLLHQQAQCSLQMSVTKLW